MKDLEISSNKKDDVNNHIVFMFAENELT